MMSRSTSRTVTLPRVTDRPQQTSAAPGAPLVEDQIREYRQSQRAKFVRERKAKKLLQKFRGKQPTSNTLEQQIAPETQLQLSMAARANIAPAEVLYRSRQDDVHHRVYTHRSEETILRVGDTQIERPFIQEESFDQLQRSHMQYIHLGVVQIRFQVLHRIEQGTMALIVLRDTRWRGDQSTFASMEVDLTKGIQMVYIVPNTMMTIADFYNHVQLVIQTRGYDEWQNGEANLLVTRGLVGRLSNTPNVGFAYEVQGVTDFLTSKGVKAIAGEKVSTEGLRSLNWIVKPPARKVIAQQPTTVQTTY